MILPNHILAIDPGTEKSPSCCGVPTMLRVRPRVTLTRLITYVRYECRGCGRTGGLAITEPEARELWP